MWHCVNKLQQESIPTAPPLSIRITARLIAYVKRAAMKILTSWSGNLAKKDGYVLSDGR